MTWTIDDSDDFYGISRWGEEFFGVNDKGELTVFPVRDDKSIQISLQDVITEMKEQNVRFPAVVRFQDVLRSRVEDLNKSFINAIKELSYCAKYRGVYPVKVNQMREVVEEIVDAGDQYSYGLEAGSKAELMSVLSMDQNLESLTILNGYKDEDYLRLAMIGRQVGRNIVIVVEKLSELKQIVELAQEYPIKPIIGIRSRLGFKSRGKWEGSSGDKAKFGLSLSEIVEAIKYLKANKYLEYLKLFHFHIGSQVPSIGSIQDAINEGARTFVEISKLGAPLEFFDIGGGLGVNYDGSSSESDSSINYTMGEYASDVVRTLMNVCDQAEIPHPNIVSESGRAITAHHSCVITKVIGEIDPSSGKVELETSEISDTALKYTKYLEESIEEVTSENFVGVYNTISKIKEESYHAYKLGLITLQERAYIEMLFWKGAKSALDFSLEDDKSSDFSIMLENMLTTQYLCNFSVFQSTADSWAIKQLLPVIPLNRLNERPSIRASLVDITCDSDGKINQFYCDGESKKFTRFHQLKEEEDYYLGIFLTGAYQDVMGDMHNLFGRLNEVHVYCHDDDPSDFYIEEIIRGQRASNVLKTMQYNPEIMAYKVKKQIDRKIAKGSISPRQGVKMIDFYENSLHDYTYLKK
jgi:arginine decarboxylase